ncbi:MAG: glycerol-3-phosphate dehydrogenase/oxidase [Chloroflexi bacterium]|nr:glycerol-3-phosphate dehydrogenase/oxidase [Chloroflexota bacterium]
METSAVLKPRAFSLGRRADHLARLRARQFDVLVVGGGITGAGIALDAAARGLSVALIEKRDFASGTSSRSTKLIHGGLRYLAQFRFRLTHEALRERSLLRRLAPHLVEPIPFIFPIYHRRREAWWVNAGLWLYDLLAGPGSMPFHRRLGPAETLQRVPSLKADGLVAGLVYYDARTDDARLVIEVLKAAVHHGATIANDVAAEEILRDQDRQAYGVLARDLASGETFPIRAHRTVIAAGIWLDEILRDHHRRVRPAKGVHIIVPRARLGGDDAVVFPTPDRRLMFVIPWQGQTLIGTTDTDYQGPLDDPRATSDDIAYILDVVNQAFPAVHLGPGDIISVQAGLRPLIASEEATTASISREDRIFEGPDGVIAIAGGKLTTYRRMAQKVTNLVVRRLQEEGKRQQVPPSWTDRIPLGGWPEANLGRADGQVEAQAPPDSAAPGLPPGASAHLWHTYGVNWRIVADLAADDPSLARPLIEGLETLRAEVVMAARHEMARTLCDALARRTHIALLDRDQGKRAAADAARLMARELGWDEVEISRQLARYEQEVEQFSAASLRQEIAR